MTLGSLAAVVNDGLVRLATEDGLDVYQALFLRGCGMILILAAAGRARGERLTRQQLTSPLLVRVAAEVVVAATFFTAIVHIEFANAHTILMVVPFVVTVIAAALGEQVTRRRYLLVGGRVRRCGRRRSAHRRRLLSLVPARHRCCGGAHRSRVRDPPS